MAAIRRLIDGAAAHVRGAEGSDTLTPAGRQTVARGVWAALLDATIRAVAPAHPLLGLPDLATARAGLPGALLQDVPALPPMDVGELSAFYEFTLASLDRASRKAEGQFFTPDDVAAVMAAQSRNTDASGAPLFAATGVWLDPCCGVGNLAMARIRAEPEAARADFVVSRLHLNDRDTTALFIARVLLAFKTDETGRGRSLEMHAALQAHSTSLDLMPAPAGPSGLDPSGSAPSSAVRATTSPLVRAVRATVTREHGAQTPLYVIVNPPYLSVSSTALPGLITSRCGDLYASALESLSTGTDGLVAVTPASYLQGGTFAPLRALLLERYADLTVLAFDNVPDNVFRGVKYGSDNTNTVNSTRAAILVAARGRQGVARAATAAPDRHQSTGFLRWRTSERATVMQASWLASQVGPITFTAEQFPKVDGDLVPLWNRAQQWAATARAEGRPAVLADLYPSERPRRGGSPAVPSPPAPPPASAGQSPVQGRRGLAARAAAAGQTDLFAPAPSAPAPAASIPVAVAPVADTSPVGEGAYTLTVPTSTRYFIPAIRGTVDRGSSRVLAFASADARDRAYLAINSSLMYWWWRIMDAGLAVSQRTLDTLPLPPALQVPLDPHGPLAALVAELRHSEDANRVVKRNAGRDNENVKHPMALVERVTAGVLAGGVDPVFASAQAAAARLARVHANSVLPTAPSGGPVPASPGSRVLDWAS